MRSKRTDSRWLGIWIGAAIFCCALFVRGAYLYNSSDNPTFENPVVDSASYDLMARDAVNKGEITQDFFWQQFFYPIFLTIIYFFSSVSIVWARVAGLIVGSMTCVLTYLLGRKIFGQSVGILAGLMTAVYGPSIFFDGELLSAGWAGFWAVLLLLVILATAEKKNSWLCFVLGVCGALSVLTRPNFILFLFAAVIWLCIVWIRNDGFVKVLLRRVVVLCAGFCMVVVPVASRNYQLTGNFSFLPGTGALNLYIGNNPDFEAVSLRPGFKWKAVVELPLRQGYKTARERRSFFYKETFKYFRKHPVRFVGGLVKKTAEFISSREMPGHIDIYLFRKWSPVLGVLVWKIGRFGFPFGLLLPLALLGMVMLRKKVPVAMWCFLVLYAASVVMTHVEARYRIAVVAPLCILASAALVEIAEFVRRKRWRYLAAVGVLFAVVGIACSIAGPFYAEKYVDYEAELHYVIGGSLEERGHTAQAAEQYREAISRKPDYLEPYHNLGALLVSEQKLDEAIRHYEQALGIVGKDAILYEGLGIALYQSGRIDEAIGYYQKAIKIDPGKASLYDNLGTAYLSLNNVDGAITYLNKAVELNPYDAVTQRNIGSALAMQGQLQAAIVHFEKSLAIQPEQVDTLSNLGGALASLGEFEKAREKFESAVRIAPDDVEIWYNLGLCFHQQGRAEEAIRAYRKVLELMPGHKNAQLALNAVLRSGK